MKGSTLILLVAVLVVGVLVGSNLQLLGELKQLRSLATEKGESPEENRSMALAPSVEQPAGRQGSEAAGRDPDAAAGGDDLVEHPVAQAAAAELSEPELLAMELEETRDALREVMKKNADLRKFILELQKLNATLTAAQNLRNVRGGPADSAQTERTETTQVVPVVPLEESRGATFHEARVLDVNPDLDMVILDKGSRDGVLLGMSFSVLRNDKVIGSLEIFDVRADVCSAVIVKRAGSEFEAGDRAIVWKD